jgi:tetratricopeptide (TPR) repeat protein
MRNFIQAAALLVAAAAVACGGGDDTAGDAFQRGFELYDSGQYEQAITAFDEAIAADPELGKAWVFRGASRWELSKDSSDSQPIEQVIQDLDRGVTLDTSSFSGFFHRALAHHKLENYQQAVSDFETALGFADNPKTQIEITYLRGLSLAELGRTDDAREAFETALAIVQDRDFKTMIQEALDGLDSSE